MSFIWDYFRLSGRIAFCKYCEYSKDYPAAAPTTYLISHLKSYHCVLHEEFISKKTSKKPQQQTIKRAFSSSVPTTSISEIDEELEELLIPSKRSTPDIVLSLKAKGPWDKDGERTLVLNKRLMEMIAVDLQPLSIVENAGFQRFIKELQPKYKLPSRREIGRELMPNMVESIKERIKKDLESVDFVSITTDCWTSKDAAHSLLSITCHYISGGPKFVVLSAKPIKGRHNALVLKELLTNVLLEYSIPKSKIFVVLRDAAEVMVKVCFDLGLKSIDCFAHKCNLAIWDGIRKLNDDVLIKNLLERVKKFVRKLKKSRVQREEFEHLQKLLDLRKLTLTKDTEVRWSSTFEMLERFLLNRQAITLLGAQDPTLPLFSVDDWATLTLLRILNPINSATNDLQKRGTPISATIPLFRVICFSLEQDNELLNVKQAIIGGLRRRMDEKIDASGNIKRTAWHNNRELVISSILDPRFKFSFLNVERHDEYKNWLIDEGESALQNFEDIIGNVESEVIVSSTHEQNSFFALFDQCKQNIATESTTDAFVTFSLPSPAALNARQKAEVIKKTFKNINQVEVNEYLRCKEISLDADPYEYWIEENSIKWPLLTKLALRFLSAPATSSESERLFSTASMILNDLRKSLLPENAEALLFLHHNIKIYNFDYD